jgi:hypothetical protein
MRLKRRSALCSTACAAKAQSPSCAGAKASPRACVPFDEPFASSDFPKSINDFSFLKQALPHIARQFPRGVLEYF